jgi:hypothetical protein
MSKPREFWLVKDNTPDGKWSHGNSWSTSKVYADKNDPRQIHVIEKSAYDTLKAECEAMTVCADANAKMLESMKAKADKLAEALSNHDCKRPRGLTPSEWLCNKCQALKEYQGEK